MDPYQHDMGLSGAGSSSGIVFIVYNLGQIAAFPFCGFLADGYGRRICIFVGCLLVLVGTAIQGSAHGLQQFIGGRFVLGFGASIASAAGPAYTVEVLLPRVIVHSLMFTGLKRMASRIRLCIFVLKAPPRDFIC